MQAHGLTNPVVDASSIAGKRRQRHAKRDGLDVRKLLTRLLRSHPGARGGWRVVHVPSIAAEDQRQLPRDLERVQQERARTIARLKGVLRSQGGRLTRLSPLPEPLEALRRWDGAPMPCGLRQRVRRVYAHDTFVREPIAAVEAERRARLHSSPDAHIEPGRQWMPLKGLGITGAWWVVRAVFGGRALKTRREVGG